MHISISKGKGKKFCKCYTHGNANNRNVGCIRINCNMMLHVRETWIIDLNHKYKIFYFCRKPSHDTVNPNVESNVKISKSVDELSGKIRLITSVSWEKKQKKQRITNDQYWKSEHHRNLQCLPNRLLEHRHLLDIFLLLHLDQTTWTVWAATFV